MPRCFTSGGIDLNLVLGDIDILIMVMCAVLSLISIKMRSWPVAFISMVGLIILSFRIYDATEDLLILGLMWAVAFIQLIYAESRSD